MIKKHWWRAILFFLAIPVVLVLGGALFSFINPEVAAGHANYVGNFLLLNQLKRMVIWGTAATVVGLWVMVCLQVIQAKKRSSAWLFFAALGPFGLAALTMLDDQSISNDAALNQTTTNQSTTNGAQLINAKPNGPEKFQTDRYARFVGKMHWMVRVGYELCCLVIAWELAYQGMVLKRVLMIRFEAARSGMSVAQVIDLQNASGGMWAFSEGLEVMFLVVLLYLLRPVVFNLVGRLVVPTASPKAN